MRLLTVPIDQLHSNAVQPKMRTTPAALAGLRAAFRKTGILVPPICVKNGKGYIVVDGHRRHETARLEGKKSIEIFVVDDDPEMLFAELNAPIRRMTGREWFMGWAQSENPREYLKSVPKGVAGHIQELVKIHGPDEARAYAIAGTCPSVIIMLRRTDQFIRQYCDSVPLKVIGRWLIEHKASVTARILCQTGFRKQADRLRKMIIANKPYKLKRRRGAK